MTTKMKIMDPERMLRILGFKFGKRVGTQIKVSCPYAANKHQSGRDDDPSCTIELEQQIFKCFACGSHGTLLQACAQKVYGLDDEASVYGLQRKYAEFIERFSAKVCDPSLAERWHQDLLENDLAIAVLAEKKGITLDTLRKYLIGWRNGRYTLPMKNEHGSIVLVKAYSTDPGVSSNDKFKKVGGFSTDLVFPVEALKEDEVILTEGEFKALLLRQMGLNAASGTTGAKGWDSAWNQFFAGKRVYVLYDNDQAGRTGALEVARCLYRTAAKIFIVTLPPFKDPDLNDITDYVVAEGHGAEDVISLIKDAPEWTPSDPSADAASPTPTLPLTTVRSLTELKEPTLVNKHVEVRALIGAEDDEPYAVPRRWVVGCLMDQGKICAKCPVNVFARTEYEMPAYRIEALRFLDLPEYLRDRELDKYSGIPLGCKDHAIKVIEHTNVRMVELLPDVEKTADSDSVDTVPAFISADIAGREANSLHSLRGFPTPHPQNQRLVLYVYQATSHSDSLDEYELTDEQVTELREAFSPKAWTADAIDARLAALYADFSDKVTGIIGRADLHLAIDLVYHSVLGFEFKGKQVNGWVDGVVVGDTATGKSETAQTMREYYGFGDKAVASTASFAGLIGSTQESVKRRRWVTRWGKVPLNDRRLLIVEECGLLNEETYQFMRDIRSSGRIIIDKAKRNAALARTRLLWIGNPRGNRPMDQFSHGILALRSIVPGDPDVRRFDFAVVAASTDVGKDALEAHWLGRTRHETAHVTREQCHDLIHWAWSRKAENVFFDKAAEDEAIRQATALSKRYSARLPLVETSMYEKLARLAAALAVRTFSTPDGQRVHVKTAHVTCVVRFLDRIYSHASSDYAGWSRLEFEKDAIEDPESLKSMLLGKESPGSAALITHSRTVVEFLLDNEYVTLSSFGMAANLNRTDAERYLGVLLRAKAMRAYPRIMDGYLKTAGFARLLREMMKDPALQDQTGEEATKEERF